MGNRAFIAVLALAGLSSTGCRTVPYTGRNQVVLVSQADAKMLGVQAYQEILKKERLSTDREEVDMIRRVGRSIARAADRPDFQWEFNLIEDDKQVNAFCLPGGKVAFYTGILPITRDERGAAVVMGHEVAHALANHGAERMSQGMLAQFGGVALSVLLADRPAATQELFAQAYGLGVGLGVLLPYSRRHEAEADEIGLILMAKAGYDPAEALEFWRRMKAASKEGPEGGPVFLRTHPTHEQRIESIRAMLPEIKRKYYKPGAGR